MEFVHIAGISIGREDQPHIRGFNIHIYLNAAGSLSEGFRTYRLFRTDLPWI
jgi:hypothetical protein